MNEITNHQISQAILSDFEYWSGIEGENIAIKNSSSMLTYKELNDLSNKTARLLLESNPDHNEPVVVICNDDLTRGICFLGVIKAGKTYIPVDQIFPKQRIQAIINLLGGGQIIVDQKSLALVAWAEGSSFQILKTDSLLADQVRSTGIIQHPKDHQAWIVFTSGSTGEPKGVIQNNLNIRFYIESVLDNLKISPGDRVATATSLTSHGGLLYTLATLSSGGSLHMMEHRGKTPGQLTQWLHEEQITILYSVPTIFRRLTSELPKYDSLPSLRVLRLSGETVTLRDVQLFQKCCSDYCIMSIGYGTSEASGIRQTTITKESNFKIGKIPFSSTIRGVDVIVQNDQGQPAEINQIGEIIVISDYLSPGYWGRPDLTDKAFSINSEGKRMYHTGDLGIFRPDGSLEHHGRKDFQVKIGGERIELEEIEIALLNLPYVTEAAIGYQEDKDRETALIAYIVLAEGVKIKRKEILDRLVEILPAYMIPKQIILMEKLPLTRDGKINKLKLPDPNLNPQEREEPFIQPTSEIEVMLVEIWKEVFNLKEISIHDNFLELGGQSIQAAKIISRVNDAFLIELNLGEILTFSTVGELSQLIVEKGRDRIP